MDNSEHLSLSMTTIQDEPGFRRAVLLGAHAMMLAYAKEARAVGYEFDTEKAMEGIAAAYGWSDMWPTLYDGYDLKTGKWINETGDSA